MSSSSTLHLLPVELLVEICRNLCSHCLGLSYDHDVIKPYAAKTSSPWCAPKRQWRAPQGVADAHYRQRLGGLASLSRSCRRLQAVAEPFLYHSLVIRVNRYPFVNTVPDLIDIVGNLSRHPHLRPLVSEIYILEWFAFSRRRNPALHGSYLTHRPSGDPSSYPGDMEFEQQHRQAHLHGQDHFSAVVGVLSAMLLQLASPNLALAHVSLPFLGHAVLDMALFLCDRKSRNYARSRDLSPLPPPPPPPEARRDNLSQQSDRLDTNGSDGWPEPNSSTSSDNRHDDDDDEEDEKDMLTRGRRLFEMLQPYVRELWTRAHNTWRLDPTSPKLKHLYLGTLCDTGPVPDNRVSWEAIVARCSASLRFLTFTSSFELLVDSCWDGAKSMIRDGGCPNSPIMPICDKPLYYLTELRIFERRSNASLSLSLSSLQKLFSAVGPHLAKVYIIDGYSDGHEPSYWSDEQPVKLADLLAVLKPRRSTTLKTLCFQVRPPDGFGAGWHWHDNLQSVALPLLAEFVKLEVLGIDTRGFYTVINHADLFDALPPNLRVLRFMARQPAKGLPVLLRQIAENRTRCVEQAGSADAIGWKGMRTLKTVAIWLGDKDCQTSSRTNDPIVGKEASELMEELGVRLKWVTAKEMFDDLDCESDSDGGGCTVAIAPA